MSGINPPPAVKKLIAAEDPIDVIPLTIPAAISPMSPSLIPLTIEPASPISASCNCCC